MPAWAMLLAAAPAVAPAASPVIEVPAVVVVASSPLSLAASAGDAMPAADLQRLQGRPLADAIGETLAGATLGGAQGNPFQQELSVRGFTASPLLGTPQGLSVWLDGVRLNEPFGDVVSWDLLPTAALGNAQWVPGSNPLFGLNTLGGAVVLKTAQGRDDGGAQFSVSGGSFGRRTVELRQGGDEGPWDHLLVLAGQQEDGFRQHGGSDVAQAFARLGWQQGGDEAHASLVLARSRLQGAQTLPASWLATPAEAYTYPDTQRNSMALLIAEASRKLQGGLRLAAQVHLRKLQGDNLSSNVDAEADPSVSARQGTNDATQLAQSSGGFAIQLHGGEGAAVAVHRWLAGASADFGRARYTQLQQDAAFTPDRGTAALSPLALQTDARTGQRTVSVHAMDTWTFAPSWALTGSLRHDRVAVSIDDAAGNAPGLDGRHRFARTDPSLALDFQPGPAWSAWLRWSEAFRAPTPMELTCADPEAPCRLPTGFLSDPPLRPVVARTVEAGAKGMAALGQGRFGELHWRAGVWRTELSDDIQFVAAGAAQAGYFRNVGRTLRQGWELQLQWRGDVLDSTLKLARTDATFRTPFVLYSPFHPLADDSGQMSVPAGARLPGIARDSLRWRVEARLPEGARIGALLAAQSGFAARGDESNTAPGARVPGFALLNLDGRWPVSGSVELWAEVANVFDRRTISGSVLGRNAFTGPGRGFDPANGRNEAFVAPGAPRGAWSGIKLRWD